MCKGLFYGLSLLLLKGVTMKCICWIDLKFDTCIIMLFSITLTAKIKEIPRLLFYSTHEIIKYKHLLLVVKK